MYVVAETIFRTEFRSLQEIEKRYVVVVMTKIQNNRGLTKGDFENHLLSHGKYKGCYDCHPLSKIGNKDLVLIYQIKSNKLIFKRIDIHKKIPL